MSLSDYLPKSSEKPKLPEKVVTVETLPSLSKKIKVFLKYINKYELDSDIKVSAAFTLLHGHTRPLHARRYKAYAYTERFIEKNGKVFLRDKEYNLIPLENLVNKDKLQKVSAFITNIVLPSFGKAVKFTILRDADEVERALKNYVALNRPISLDIETSGLDPYTCDICGIGLASSASGGVYIPLNHRRSPDIERLLTENPEDTDYTHPDKDKTVALLKKYLPELQVLGHNMKFEYSFFKVTLGVDLNIAHCTMLGEYTLDERLKYRYNLGMSVSERFPLIPKWKEAKEFITNIKKLPPNMVGRYCVRDCAYTYLLYLAQLAYITKYFNRLFFDIELPYIKCAADAELHGFELDKEYIKQLSSDLLRMQAEVDTAIYERVGKEFDIDSVKQLQQILYTDMQFPIIKTTKTGISTDKGTLEILRDRTNDPIFQNLLDHRSYKKLSSTYTLGYLEQLNKITGRLHPSFMLTTTVTGRISCTNPNLQNIPKAASSLIRKIFLAPKGYVLIFSDYSGQEVRVLAALSKDENMIKAYNPCYKCTKISTKLCPKEQGKKELPAACQQVEIHSLVTSKVFSKEIGDTPVWEIKQKFPKLRARAKAVTFALLYGSTVQGIADKQGMTVEEAQQLVDEYFRQFPTIEAMIDRIHAGAIEDGYIHDMAGRRRRFKYLGIPVDKNDNDSPFWQELDKQDNGYWRGVKKGWYGKITGELRQAQNFPMQGSSASMTKEASVCLRNRYSKLNSRPSIIGFIHDRLCRD